MSIADFGPVLGKHCFTYCGDDFCDCEMAPRYRDRDGTATAAANGDLPVPQDCQARAGTASPKVSP